MGKGGRNEGRLVSGDRNSRREQRDRERQTQREIQREKEE